MLIVRSRNATHIHAQQSGDQPKGKEYGSDDRKQIHGSIHTFRRLMTPGFLGDGSPVSGRIQIFYEAGGFVCELFQWGFEFGFKPMREFGFKVGEQLTLGSQVSSQSDDAAPEVCKVLFGVSIFRTENRFFHFVHFVIDVLDNLVSQVQHALDALDQPIGDIFGALTFIESADDFLSGHHPAVTESDDQPFLNPDPQCHHVFGIRLRIQINPAQYHQEPLFGGKASGLGVCIDQCPGNQWRQFQFLSNPSPDFVILIVSMEPGRLVGCGRGWFKIKRGRRARSVSGQLSRKNPRIACCHNGIMPSELRKSIEKQAGYKNPYHHN